MLYWLCYRHNNQVSVVIEPGASLIHARMRAALNNLDQGTFTEGHELDRKWQVPKGMIGRRLSKACPHVPVLIRETSTETRMIATDITNANVAATAPIENGFLNIKSPSQPIDEFFASEKGTCYKQSQDVKPHPQRGSKPRPKKNTFQRL
jgi:hypothetical protein